MEGKVSQERSIIAACAFFLILGILVGFFFKPTTLPTTSSARQKMGMQRVINPLTTLPSGYSVDQRNSSFPFGTVTNLGIGCAEALYKPQDTVFEVTCGITVLFQVSSLADGVPVIEGFQNQGMQTNCSYTDTLASYPSSYSIPELCGRFLIVMYQVIGSYRQFCAIDTTDLDITSHIGCVFLLPFAGGPFEPVYSPSGISEGDIVFAYLP